MSDATLSQVKELLERLARENDPRAAAQRLIENWGPVQQIMRGEIDQATFETALAVYFKSEVAQYGLFGRSPRLDNPFDQQCVEPECFYPPGFVTNPPKKQLELLRAGFSGKTLEAVDLDGKIRGLGPAPQWADGPYPYLAIRRLKLASLANIVLDRERFGLVLEQIVFAAVRQQRQFNNWRAGQMGPDYYRVRQQTWDAQDKLEAQQPDGDIVAFWGQSGRLGAGASVQLCRHEIDQAEQPAQWGWSAYEVLMCVLANPHRLARYEDLGIDCPGDEYRLRPTDSFDGALFFSVVGDELFYANEFINLVDPECGSASGFLR